jgi:hypothetical protein
MSDDEDTFDGEGKLIPNVYTSRAPDSRSIIVSEPEYVFS